jgi:lysophospholipid acyltransferase (LPLAT)-like uncharacterized protein
MPPLMRETLSNRLKDEVYKFADLSSYSLKERLLIRAIDLSSFLFVNLIGKTTRIKVEGWTNWEMATSNGHIPIYTFWHNQLILAAYFWRRRNIVVMTSRSFDGEYIARVLQRFGCGVARGSSTRGAIGALVEMVKLMRGGLPMAFTIDGPKGPRYVAKMGAVMLAKKTGHPILPFSIIPSRFLEIPSWDKLQVSVPFSQATVKIAPPIWVPSNADDSLIQSKRDELQKVLDSINRDSTLEPRG